MANCAIEGVRRRKAMLKENWTKDVPIQEPCSLVVTAKRKRVGVMFLPPVLCWW
jgi:hypothetical protein